MSIYLLICHPGLAKFLTFHFPSFTFHFQLSSPVEDSSIFSLDISLEGCNIFITESDFVNSIVFTRMLNYLSLNTEYIRNVQL